MNVIIDGVDQISDIWHNTYEAEHHLHNQNVWLGNGAVEDSLTGYTVTSGNGAFGAETLLIDVADVPKRTGNIKFDISFFSPLTISSATVYIVRLIWGTGLVAAAEAANQYTEIAVSSTGVGSTVRGFPMPVTMPDIVVGTKVWAKCKNATNLATITFLIAEHEYAR